MKHFFLFIATVLYISLAVAQQKTVAMLIYKNKTLPVDSRVKDLLSRMTVEEKAGQLNQLNGGAFTGPAVNDAGQQGKMKLVKEGKVGSMLNVVGAADTKAIQEEAMKSRLGIPLLFGYDVIHGYKTIFPIPLADACAWDENLSEQAASVAAKEAASAGLHWTFAPMADVSNDTRWGRVMEGAGEDPFLASKITAARVKGFQGKLNDKEHILACVKHFAAYGLSEAGREYNTVDVSRVQAYNKYFPPYKAAVDAGVASVMNAFNIFDGVPASGNKFLVTEVLKKQWGFKGFIVSDWNSFGEMISHGYAEDGKDAASKALQAGSMMDMEGKVSVEYIPALLKEKKITMAQLDEAVGKILEAKFKLGLFDAPYAFSDTERERSNLFTAAHRQSAKNAAMRSVVLLKNDNATLPISVDTKIALVGFYAESKDDLFDFWKGQGVAADAVSLKEGMEAKFKNLHYSKGYNSDGNSTDALINEAVANSKDASVIFVNIGISGKWAGEDRSLTNPVVPQGQLDLLKALKATGKRVVALVSSGRPLVLTEVAPLTDAILQCWILGTEHGSAIAEVLTGGYNPSAKTVMSFPYSVGQIPVYYNQFSTGRPEQTDGQGNWYSRFRDAPREAFYPFGFGLSYTSFNYGKPSINKNSIKVNESATISVSVTNTGKVAGEEIVQLYIRDIAASVVRPVKELKGFKKINLQPGESQKVEFSIGKNELGFYTETGKYVVEPGRFKAFVGGSSVDVQEVDLVIW